MGWEKRRGKLYYYRKKRTGKHVHSEYAGTGSAGEFAEALDMVNRDKRAGEQASLREQRKDRVSLDRLATEFNATASLLAKVALLLSGAHTHKGEWRRGRRRNGQTTDSDETTKQ